MIRKLKYFFEKIGFNVVGRVSRKLGLSTSKTRIYFIYSSFILFGVPYILYLFLALGFKVKDVFIFKRKSVFDL